jgi:hypothetical protein
MNRLILIGNGFDIAHGLKTKYSEFINEFWKKQVIELENNNLKLEWENEFVRFSNNTEPPFIFDSPINSVSDLYDFFKKKNINFIFKNFFLSNISTQLKKNTWVDIEIEYYRSLLKIFNRDDSIHLMHDIKLNSIEDLNNEFNQIKIELVKYLIEIQNNFDVNLPEFLKTKRKITDNIYKKIKIEELTSKKINEFEKLLERKVNESNLKVDLLKSVNCGKFYKINDLANNHLDLFPSNFLFLNFNYTDTENNYEAKDINFDINLLKEKIITSNTIHIHGNLNNEENPIIFGYGDELDENYLKIENLNDNKFLENIKSVKYLETDNYKNLLEFIESDEYQIYIMGHSCGISDRTLLNTIFEHDNCVSIKVFYHKFKKDNESNYTDNFQDIIKNISRNFKDKVKMRDRVVNKKYSSSLT